jgi:hypothetical protein
MTRAGPAKIDATVAQTIQKALREATTYLNLFKKFDKSGRCFECHENMNILGTIDISHRLILIE